MKLLISLLLLVGVQSFAAETTVFCVDENQFTLVVDKDRLSLNNGYETTTFILDETVIMTGEDADADAGLANEDLTSTVVYKIRPLVETEDNTWFAILNGVSGNKYLVDVYSYKVLATTKACQ